MPFTETVTIINNSGKIISTGKQLVNIFKEAKAAYKDKKDSLKSDKPPGIKRAQTFDVTPRGLPQQQYYDYGGYDERDHVYDRPAIRDGSGRRRSIDDGHSLTSSHRSGRSKRSTRHRSSSHHRPPLTESNLRTLSEVSSTAPSVTSRAYRSPYAETVPHDLTLSRPTLARATTMTVPPASTVYRAPPAPPTVTETATAVSTPRQSMLVHRPRSESSLRKKPKEIDMNLAYGNIPPDLESRVDLDPVYKASPEYQEAKAKSLMERIEGLLLEAQCIQHTATSIIAHLQGNPEAAAAVALTLAELSALLGKMSPAFLGIVKGGSPAVFALLASPQFLIGAGVAVGVTVVMFGGWKIVKRIRDAKKENAEAFEMQPPATVAGSEVDPYAPNGYPNGYPADYGFMRGAAFGDGFDEALVLEEELSTIESWRRGITPFGEDGTADIELMSPEAQRNMKERHRSSRDDDGIDPSDSVSRSGRTERTSRTHRTSKTHRSHKSRRHSERGDDDLDVPERKSSKAFKDRDGESETGDGDRSERSHRSHRSSQSKRTERVALKAIEDGSKDSENTLDAVLRPKEKKNNMLKTLFKKKKDKEDKERTATSVLV